MLENNLIQAPNISSELRAYGVFCGCGGSADQYAAHAQRSRRRDEEKRYCRGSRGVEGVRRPAQRVKRTIRAVFRRVVTSRLPDGKYCDIVFLSRSVEFSEKRQKV